jgi:OTU domain-containing protein 6
MKARHEAEIKGVSASGGGTEEVGGGGGAAMSDNNDQNGSSAGADANATAEEEERQRVRVLKEQRGLKKEKARAKERQQQQDMADETANAGPAARDVEMQIIQSKLPVGFRMEEVAADGHCLYRAVAAQHSDSGDLTYSHIRTYLLYHADY